MPTNKDFLKRLGAGKASFFLADFHVHSPASHDFMGPEKVESTSPDVLDELSNSDSISHLNENAKHEAVVIDIQAPDVFYDALVIHRNKLAEEEGIQSGEDWAFVAITDHDVCRNSVRLANYAWSNDRLKQNRLVILPGIELSVEFTVPDTSPTAAVHLLLAFPPLTEAEHIHAVIRDASAKAWEFGQGISVDDLPKFVGGIRHHSQYPAICIAAHVGSSKGVREEAKNCILSHLEAEITRAEGELQTPGLQDRDALEARLEQFKEKLSDPDAVSVEVLQLIGTCGFDALQTRGSKDESYYRRLHRFRDGFGRSVSIVCSDAHEADAVFLFSEPDQPDALVPYIKLSNVSNKTEPKVLFGEIKDKALKLGETRTTYKAPEQVTSWIEGVEIIPDATDAATFWPFEKDGDGSPTRFTVQLSRNLNCVIGGRGSGKSALIESLAFLCTPDDFNGKVHQREEDWYQRAAATLRGCRVRICWRALDASGNELPRRAFFMNRYFDGAHKHSAVTCLNLDEKELLPGIISPPSIHIFRIHDIEKTAKPELLRSLFDKICGEEIEGLSKQINDAVQSLASHRNQMVGIARQIAALTKEDGPLRQYARRKHDYDDVNKPEIQEQYQKIDEAAAAESIASSLDGSWEEVGTVLDLGSTSEQIREWFAESRSAVLQPPSADDSTNADEDTDDDDEHSAAASRPLCGPIASAIEGNEGDGDEVTTADTRILKAIESVQNECGKVTSALQSAKGSVETTHREARELLANKGYPTGSAERQTKKTAFEEAESDLKSYRALWGEWDQLESEGRKLFETLKSLCQKRTEIRKSTAERITQSLAANLDPTILLIDADAQPIADVSNLQSWLQKHVHWSAQSKTKRFAELSQHVSPEKLRSLFLTKNTPSVSTLVIDKPSVAQGRITTEDAKTIIKNTAGIQQLDAESTNKDDPEFFETLPDEVQNGLWTFPTKPNDSDEFLVDAALMLDEVILDDLPVIRLNDRPSETDAMKPLGKLSPGQRCSAILPILLLNGTSPLVIDQPEDNLDNRLIRQVIVNVLSSIKLKRQVIVATHNPNLPVLGDAEQVIVLRAVEDEQCQLEAQGDLDQQPVVQSITEIMEGGREAFQYRHTIYREHWSGGAEAE